MKGALAPVMTKPNRNAVPNNIAASSRTFFVTTKTHQGKTLLQPERNAMLLIDVLRTCVTRRKFQVHDFVVMPNHVHILLTVDCSISIERAVQLIKGGFSYRLRKELSYTGEVWQRGFSEVRINTQKHYDACRAYIAQNPVDAGLATAPELYPFRFASPTQKKQGLKPLDKEHLNGTAEAVP